MELPNITGINIYNRKINIPMPNKAPVKNKTTLKNIASRKSSFIEDVDLLVSGYNDKAFLYNSGKVDLFKDGKIKTIKFSTKQAASLYLMKVGWKYV